MMSRSDSNPLYKLIIVIFDGEDRFQGTFTQSGIFPIFDDHYVACCFLIFERFSEGSVNQVYALSVLLQYSPLAQFFNIGY